MSVPAPKIELSKTKIQGYKNFILAQIDEGKMQDAEQFAYFSKIKKGHADNKEMLKAVGIIEKHKIFIVKRKMITTLKSFLIDGKLSTQAEKALLEYVQDFKEKNKNCPLLIKMMDDILIDEKLLKAKISTALLSSREEVLRIVTLFLEGAKKEYSKFFSKYNDLPLLDQAAICAIIMGRLDIVTHLIDDLNYSPNSVVKDEGPLLSFACKYLHYGRPVADDIIQFLLNRSADVNQVDLPENQQSLYCLLNRFMTFMARVICIEYDEDLTQLPRAASFYGELPDKSEICACTLKVIKAIMLRKKYSTERNKKEGSPVYLLLADPNLSQYGQFEAWNELVCFLIENSRIDYSATYQKFKPLQMYQTLISMKFETILDRATDRQNYVHPEVFACILNDMHSQLGEIFQAKVFEQFQSNASTAIQPLQLVDSKTDKEKEEKERLERRVGLYFGHEDMETRMGLSLGNAEKGIKQDVFGSLNDILQSTLQGFTTQRITRKDIHEFFSRNQRPSQSSENAGLTMAQMETILFSTSQPGSAGTVKPLDLAPTLITGTTITTCFAFASPYAENNGNNLSFTITNPQGNTVRFTSADINAGSISFTSHSMDFEAEGMHDMSFRSATILDGFANIRGFTGSPWRSWHDPVAIHRACMPQSDLGGINRMYRMPAADLVMELGLKTVRTLRRIYFAGVCMRELDMLIPPLQEKVCEYVGRKELLFAYNPRKQAARKRLLPPQQVNETEASTLSTAPLTLTFPK